MATEIHALVRTRLIAGRTAVLRPAVLAALMATACGTTTAPSTTSTPALGIDRAPDSHVTDVWQSPGA